SWLKWSGAWRLRSGRDLLSLHARIKMPLGGGKTKRYRKRRAPDYSKKLLKPAGRLKKISVREKAAG
ncbi:MAG: hypothetical protein HAW59_03450, partial [Betaproteobacteria bacterium]|nr:hypothetical protein [Betaproteobacteria bacterium]